MHYTYWWLLAAVGLGPSVLVLAFKWLVAPLIIRRKQTSPKVRLRQETSADQLTPELQAFYGGLITEFRSEGFDVVSNTYSPKGVGNLDAIEMLLVHRDRGDAASIIAGLNDKIRAMAFQCLTRYPDGQLWKTVASTRAEIFPPEPGTHSIRCDWVRSAAELYAFHRRRIVDAGRDGDIGVVPAVGNEVEFLQVVEQRLNDWLVRCGYRRLDPVAQVWRYTIKGAYLGVWKSLKPIKSWRLRRQEKIARREWQRLGMHVWVPDTHPEAMVQQTIDEPAQTVPESSTLQYTTGPQPGVIKYLEHDDVLTVLVGRVTVGALLKRYWFALLLIAFLIEVDGMVIYHAWIVHHLLGIPIWYMLRQPLIAFVFVITIVSALPIRSIWRMWRTITLRASHKGLSYENVPSRPHRSTLDRADILSLDVVISEFSLFRRKYKLLARRHGVLRPVTLIDGQTKTALLSANDRLQHALGLKRVVSDTIEGSSHVALAAPSTKVDE